MAYVDKAKPIYDATGVLPYTSGNWKYDEILGAANRNTDNNLGMEDFLALMVAQMQNQDIFNPVSDTDFIAQMAQFSALEGVNALQTQIEIMQQYQISSYAVNYVGKEVIIATVDEDGEIEKIRGVVERVDFSSGEPLVYIEGKGYPLYTVMEVVTPDYVEKPTEPEKPGDGDDGEDGEDGGNTGGVEGGGEIEGEVRYRHYL